MIKPFKLKVPNKTITEIYSKVKKYPWSNIQDMNGWEHGTNFKYLKEISKYKNGEIILEKIRYDKEGKIIQ